LPGGANTSVRIAAQTLSHSVACGIEFTNPAKKLHAEAIHTINDVRQFYYCLDLVYLEIFFRDLMF